jgi:transcriptional regulator with XRE-family HTH domain
MSERETFGRWLKQRRKWLDLTQHALAAQSGRTVETIRKLEADKRRPSRQLVARLAETLQIPAADRAVFHQLARGRTYAVPRTPLQAPAADLQEAFASGVAVSPITMRSPSGCVSKP